MKRKFLTIAFVATVATLFSFTNEITEDIFNIVPDKSEVIWKATKVSGAHEGTVKIKSGSLNLENDLIARGEFIIDMTTIETTDTKSKKLNKHLNSADFFDTQKYTTAGLIITSSKKLENRDMEVSGELTIKGISKPTTFIVKRTAKTENFAIYNAEIKVDRTKYGITYKSSTVGDAFIADNFDLYIKLVAKKKS